MLFLFITKLCQVKIYHSLLVLNFLILPVTTALRPAACVVSKFRVFSRIPLHPTGGVLGNQIKRQYPYFIFHYFCFFLFIYNFSVVFFGVEKCPVKVSTCPTSFGAHKVCIPQNIALTKPKLDLVL